jgi:excisionase family DNA binding protein
MERSMPKDEREVYFSVEQVAALLGLTRQRIYQLVEGGKIATRETRPERRIAHSEVERLRVERQEGKR